MASSNTLLSPSISSFTLSFLTAIWRSWPTVNSSSFSLVSLVPADSPLGPLLTVLPGSNSYSRVFSERSMIARSSSRSLPRRSISARSMARARSSLSTPRRENTRTSTTVPVTPGGTRSEVSRTSEAFSPKIARSSFSSGVIGVSPFGVTLPTRMSPAFTSAPI